LPVVRYLAPDRAPIDRMLRPPSALLFEGPQSVVERLEIVFELRDAGCEQLGGVRHADPAMPVGIE
jgi:hypothetical protein